MNLRYEIGPGEPPSVALATVISALYGEEPTGIEPLAEFVDLESIDRFFSSRSTAAPWDPSVRLALDKHVLTIEESAIVVESVGQPADDSPGPGGNPTGVPPVEPADTVGATRDAPTGRDDWTVDSNVLLLAPSNSGAEKKTCSELLPSDAEGAAATLELSFGPTSTDLASIGADTAETLRRWGDRYDDVGLCVDSLSALVRNAGLESTCRFLLLLSGHVSRTGAVAHYHADPDDHDIETTYVLESLVNAIVVAGDVDIAPTRRP